MRVYFCKTCRIKLLEGCEYQFPPRLSYWYCPQCQVVFEENDTQSGVGLIGPVKGNEDKCIQDFNVRGLEMNTDTGARIFKETL